MVLNKLQLLTLDNEDVIVLFLQGKRGKGHKEKGHNERVQVIIWNDVTNESGLPYHIWNIRFQALFRLSLLL